MILYEKAQHHLNSKQPFVLFHKPNAPKIVGVFQRNNQLFELNDYAESGFVFVSFDGKQRYILPLNVSDVVVDTFTETDFHWSKDIELQVDKVAKINFEKLVQDGIDAIRENHFKKVVLSRTEVMELQVDVIAVFQKFLAHYPSAFVYCFYHPQMGLWMGATPEQFIKIKGNHLSTVALAGTQLFKEQLVWESKEREEQQFVTEFIAKSLVDDALDITVSEPRTVQAGNLAHLKTDIAATITKEKVEAIIQKLHPTPAVCGLPKESARQFILQNEGYNRDFYTGFLGELNVDFTNFGKENSDLFVNLRCMKVANNQVNVYVGCGITRDSNPEKEFMETLHKSLTVKRVLL